MFAEVSSTQLGKNPYGVMDKDVLSDEERLEISFESEEHDYTTSKPKIQANNLNVQLTWINVFLDPACFPQEKVKLDYEAAETGKMMEEVNKPISPHKFSSMIKIFEINFMDQHDSTLNSSKREHNQIFSNSESESVIESLELSQKSKENTIQGRNQRLLLQKDEINDKRIGKKKKDQRKNVCHNCFKFIVKEFLSQKYTKSVECLCRDNGIDIDAVRSYYKDKLSWNISLSKLRVLLNFKQPQIDDDLRKIKQTFHTFFVFYMRHRYNHHIFTEDKIKFKAEYLEAKRHLMYLPDIKPLPKFNKYLSQS